MNKILAVLFLFPTLSFANTEAETLAASSTAPSVWNRMAEYSYARFSVLSSRSNLKTDFASLKSVGSDETGSFSERTVMPNQTFLSAFSIIRPGRNHETLFVVLQSFEPEADRVVNLPVGTKITIPGRIAVARYRYSFTREFSAALGIVHADTFGYSDPYMGLYYAKNNDAGWMNRVDLRLSAPLTQKSKTEKLQTKATLRYGTMLRTENFVNTAGVSHTQSFYEDPSLLDKSARPATSGSKGGARPPALSALDNVLLQKEKSRSVAYLGTSYQASQRIRLSTLGSTSYISTFKDKHFWITNLKPIAATYTRGNVELGSSFELYSDIQKYKRPSFPKFWSVGVSLSYNMGSFPYSI